MNGWINLYKPKGISSAKAVSIVKKLIKPAKIGHSGTLDVEAEGILPLALGEATKLIKFIMDAKKEYIFTIKFGARTDTKDASGNILEYTENLPTKEDCQSIVNNFIGEIYQVPPSFSALKVNGVRSYKLARSGILQKLEPRLISIYDLKCLDFCFSQATATYIVECSKGTYIRTLAEDIALSLQSLGFVLELRRTKVGIFTLENTVHISELENYLNNNQNNQEQGNQEHDLQIRSFLENNSMKIEAVLDDIPVLIASKEQAKQIKFGQKCFFDHSNSFGNSFESVWINYGGKIIAIGSLIDDCFISSRVFNL